MILSQKPNIKTSLDHKVFAQLYGVAGIKIFKASLNNDIVELFAIFQKQSAKCPSCHSSSRTIRSRYSRRLMDLPIGTMKVVIHLIARKFRWNNTQCPQIIFCEQNRELTNKYSRKTNPIIELLTKILVEISSVKGSHLTSLLNIGHSSSSCLRFVHNH